jgi:hypothetical protein
VLGADQLAELDRTGVLKLPGMFTADDAARMRDVVWKELFRRYGIDRSDAATWGSHPPTGMKTSKRHRAFAPILGPDVRRVFDDLFGADRWVGPKHFGQVLVTMPAAQPWRVPARVWHADFQYYAPFEPLFALKYWGLFSDLEPGGGGTLLLAGSHRLTARFIAGRSHAEREYKRVRDALLRSHPWLKALSSEDDDPGRNARFMAAEADVDGIPAQVVECTGNAGDVYITHPWVMHCIAPNVRSTPRFMRSFGVYRAV